MNKAIKARLARLEMALKNRQGVVLDYRQALSDKLAALARRLADSGASPSSPAEHVAALMNKGDLAGANSKLLEVIHAKY